MPNIAFDIYKPKPQIAQRRPQPFDTGEALTTALGTTAESAIDMATFGIWQPDIIPEEIELEHPWATAFGRIVGSTAGLLAPGVGSMGTATKGTMGLFKVFGWGAKYSNFLQTAGTAAKMGKLPLQSLGMGASVFAVHDAAREIIRQTKEQQPDLHAVGMEALKGSIFGGLLGHMGSFSHTLHWNKQGLTMAATMGVAEALSDAADGVDVFSEDWAKSRLPFAILQGYAFGLYNSRGWKGRRDIAEKAGSEAWLKSLIQREMVVSIKQDTKTVYEVTKKRVYNELMSKRPGITKKEMPPEIHKAVEAASKFIAEDISTTDTLFLKEKARIHKYGRETGMIIYGEKGKVTDDRLYRQWLKQQTGGEDIPGKQFISEWGPVDKTKRAGKRSAKDLTYDEWVNIRDNLQSYVDTQIKTYYGDPKYIKDIGIGSAAKPPDRLFREIGLYDMTNVEQMVDGSLLFKLENHAVRNTFYNIKKRWDRTYKALNPKDKISIKQKARNLAFGETTTSDKLLNRAIQAEKIFESLPPQLKNIAEEIRVITKVMHGRYNEVMKALGLPDIGYIEWYLPHQIDWAKARKDGYNTKGLDPATRTSAPYGRVTDRHKLSPEYQRKLHEYPLKENPWEVLKSVMRTELKGIHLHEPIKIVHDQLDELQSLGVYTPAQVGDIKRVIETVVWGKPTDQTIKAHNTIRNLLEKNEVGKAFQKMATHFNQELGQNLPDAFNNIWGKTVSYGYIGLRPVLAFRNLLQFTYGHALYGTKHVAKGLLGADNARVTEYKKKTPFYKFSAQMAGEHIGATGALDNVMFQVYGKSHIGNVDIVTRAADSQMMDWITNPKYEKRVGFATKEGIALRAKLRKEGNPQWRNAITGTELNYVNQEMEYGANTTQFLYDALGLPLITRSEVAAPFFKLTSYPLNYATKFLPELAYRMIKGKPYYARNMDVKLPWEARLGAIRHFVFLSALVAGLEKLGFDYSSLIGIGYTPSKGFITPLSKEGVLQMRPSPLVNGLIYAKDWMVGNEREKKIAIRQLQRMAPVPGIMAFRDIQKVAEHDDIGRFLFKYPYEPKKKKKSMAFPAFKQFKPF